LKKPSTTVPVSGGVNLTVRESCSSGTDSSLTVSLTSEIVIEIRKYHSKTHYYHVETRTEEHHFREKAFSTGL